MAKKKKKQGIEDSAQFISDWLHGNRRHSGTPKPSTPKPSVPKPGQWSANQRDRFRVLQKSKRSK
jgi:hypothetical protein